MSQFVLRKIYKTGLLAAVAAVGFGVFAYVAAGWSRRGAAVVECSSTMRIVPQVALGSFDNGATAYTTTIEIVNTGDSDQRAGAGFYNVTGGPLTDVSLEAGGAAVTNGIVEGITIAKHGAFVISGAGMTGTLGWARITGCGGLAVTSFYERRDTQSNRLLSRVRTAASPTDLTRFIIPRIGDVSSRSDIGIALVNTARDGSATVTAEVVDEAGTVLKSEQIRLAAGEQAVKFAGELFALRDQPADAKDRYVRFTSTSPTLAASAFGVEGDQLTNVPVEIVR